MSHDTWARFKKISRKYLCLLKSVEVSRNAREMRIQALMVFGYILAFRLCMSEKKIFMFSHG